MKNISELLAKFASLGLQDRKIKEEIHKVLQEFLSKEIKKEQIKIKDKKITLQITGPAKTEIVLNKKVILNNINQALEELNSNILDIN